MSDQNYGTPYQGANPEGGFQQQPYQQQPYQQQPYQQPNPQQGGYQGDAYHRPPMPKTYLVESILMILFCCLPLGIVALIKGQEVNSLYQSGQYDRAQEASDKAAYWLKWGLGVGIVVITLYIILYVVVLGMALANS